MTRAAIILPLLVLGGCVYAGAGTDDVTTWNQDGTVSHTNRKHIDYQDTRQAGQMASGMLDSFGGLGGILGSLTGTQALWGGGGLLALLLGGTHKIGNLSGQNKGYEQHQIESAAVVPSATPVKGAA